MDIANLRAFVAIAESASFSTAAENLHLTQPAISKRVAALENSFGARLFDRIVQDPRQDSSHSMRAAYARAFIQD